MTPIFSGVGTAIGHEPDEPQSVPVVPAAAWNFDNWHHQLIP